MLDVEFAVAAATVAVHEAMLFAAIGLAIGGFDDLLVDALYLIRLGRRWLHDVRPETLDDLPVPESGRMVIFVAAWDEGAVIGAMLRTALARIDHPDWQIYVGTYPNDRSTIAAVAEVAEGDDRVRLVIGTHPGPTTKADCLNTIWHALLADERAAGSTVRSITLHDAEDVLHPGELRVQAAMLERGYDVVQLPVIPLLDQQSRLVAGHYADEFAEAHAKVMLVRQALGASMPLAGVGCAIDRDMLGRVAAARGGVPFDPASLTEDYELGLTIGQIGGRATFARVSEAPGGMPVAVRAFFPAALEAAVRQKARWMTGIALAGWDRTGWAHPLALGDHWMRMRDRRAIMSVLVLFAAYFALVGWAGLAVLHFWRGTSAPPVGPVLEWLLGVNALILVWRMIVRAGFVGDAYGWREAAWAIPRMVVSNLIAILSARRAVFRYIALLAGRPLRWDKTAHHFPVMSGDAR